MKPKVVVFSSKKALLGKIEALKKSRSFDLSVEEPTSAEGYTGRSGEHVVAYLDATFFQIKDLRKLATRGGDRLKFGIMDHTGVITDPAELFHAGAVDYIGKSLLQQGLTGKRVKRTIDFCRFPVADSIPISENWKLSGNDWRGVKSGSEYTFCFMFVEIDLISEWKQKSGRAHLDKVKAMFQKHIQLFAEKLSGKIWMWMDLGGLILFPFDGKSCDAILHGVRLVLNRTIISAEYYRYNTLVTYRIALHIGNTVYKSRGKTSTIVSDTVNYLFHLGHQFAEPGNFYLTEPLVPFIPEGLADYFVPVGEF